MGTLGMHVREHGLQVVCHGVALAYVQPHPSPNEDTEENTHNSNAPPPIPLLTAPF